MKNHLLAAAVFVSLFSSACAGEKAVISKEEPSAFPFEKGAHEIQLLGGAFFGIEHNSDKRPQLNDGDVAIRLGWMLGDVCGNGWSRGNLELLAEAFGAKTFTGPGGELAGGEALLRYNFVQPDARLIPFLQIGGGALWNNVSDDHTQRLIGSEFEFDLSANFGARWMLGKNWAISGEFSYRHISNANTASRNNGLNSLGGLLGVSRFF